MCSSSMRYWRLATRYSRRNVSAPCTICAVGGGPCCSYPTTWRRSRIYARRSEEHTSELQSRLHLVCRLLLEKKKLETKQIALVIAPHVEGSTPAQHHGHCV